MHERPPIGRALVERQPLLPALDDADIADLHKPQSRALAIDCLVAFGIFPQVTHVEIELHGRTADHFPRRGDRVDAALDARPTRVQRFEHETDACLVCDCCQRGNAFSHAGARSFGRQRGFPSWQDVEDAGPDFRRRVDQASIASILTVGRFPQKEAGAVDRAYAKSANRQLTAQGGERHLVECALGQPDACEARPRHQLEKGRQPHMRRAEVVIDAELQSGDGRHRAS